MGFDTKAVHTGEEPDFVGHPSGDVVVPIHLSSTFARLDVNEPTGGYEYSRSGNPTRFALEKKLAAIENAKFGLAFSSGLAAETTLVLSLLKAGDHVVAFDDLYGGTRRLFSQVFQERFGIKFSYVDARDPELISAAIQDNTRIIWLETPTNPLLRLCDISKISDIAHKAGALVVVDNTFASPYFQQPIGLGADVVVHSTTKYINGHSDSIGGALITSNEELFKALRYNQNAAGAILSPFDSFLVSRGIKTLALRMERHEKNAIAIATYLENNDKIEGVYYPGLASHPQHDLAKRQMTGFSGMLSFEIKGGEREAQKFLSNLHLFALAESLGGVESLIEHPATMTHASIPPEERRKIGVSDALIRISVGIENVEDLIFDLDQALKQI
ncbi:MAG TPA: cystathionine gamma-synthase [Methanospirillum sp.]|uniref:cystathionine gamma-synthase n=1 Tax=Methanospirillum sp. TaxID=45200 RepID=UPI002C9E067F|nr:cystathionine gamma-synthase [Methanospirillum sp.]HWQ63138.1 cystathionine gamma-synthase [Methanospirillum sp.]